MLRQRKKYKCISVACQVLHCQDISCYNNNTNKYIEEEQICTTRIWFVSFARNCFCISCFFFCYLSVHYFLVRAVIFWLLTLFITFTIFYSPPSIVKVKNTWSYTFTPLRAFTACRGATLPSLSIYSRHFIKDCNCDCHTQAGCRKLYWHFIWDLPKCFTHHTHGRCAVSGCSNVKSPLSTPPLQSSTHWKDLLIPPRWRHDIPVGCPSFQTPSVTKRTIRLLISLVASTKWSLRSKLLRTRTFVRFKCCDKLLATSFGKIEVAQISPERITL